MGGESEESKAIQEGSKAIQAAARFGGKAVDAATRLGVYVGEVFGKVPHDAVGLLGGDYLHEARLRNAVWLRVNTRKKLEARGILAPRPLSPAIAVPLIEAAIDESREELQELWARLLANAMDPSRPHVRQSYIEVLRKFDPQDALLLGRMKHVFTTGIRLGGGDVNTLAESIMRSNEDEVRASLARLIQLGCVETDHADIRSSQKAKISPFGRLLLAACAD